MLGEILLGKDITQISLQCAFKFEQSPLQLRIQSTEMLSAMEYEVFQVGSTERRAPFAQF